MRQARSEDFRAERRHPPQQAQGGRARPRSTTPRAAPVQQIPCSTRGGTATRPSRPLHSKRSGLVPSSPHPLARPRTRDLLPVTSARPLAHASLTELADAARLNCAARLDTERRVEMRQFFTPAIVGRFMASMFTPRRRVRLLDPGAGVGSLTAAFVETAMTWSERPVEIDVAAFEADDQVLSPLRSTLAACRRACRDNGVRFSARVIADDFIHAAVASLDEGLLREPAILPFDAVIMNPPYRKIRSSSRERTTLRRSSTGTSERSRRPGPHCLHGPRGGLPGAQVPPSEADERDRTVGVPGDPRRRPCRMAEGPEPQGPGDRAMAQLRELGDAIDGEMPDQGILDRLVAGVVGA